MTSLWELTVLWDRCQQITKYSPTNHNIESIDQRNLKWTGLYRCQIWHLVFDIWTTSAWHLENGFATLTSGTIYGAQLCADLNASVRIKRIFFSVLLGPFDSICGRTSNFISFLACFDSFFVSRCHQMSVLTSGEFLMTPGIDIWRLPWHLRIPALLWLVLHDSSSTH